MSTSIQLTTFAKTSAPSSRLRPASLTASSSSSLALFCSYSSKGISPGNALTVGKRPGAPWVKSLARSIATPGAVASGVKRLFRSVSRLFLFLANMDLIPRPRFLGEGLPTGAGNSFPSNTLDSLSPFTDLSISSLLISMAILSIVSAASAVFSLVESSSSVIPIKRLNCRFLSASSIGFPCDFLSITNLPPTATAINPATFPNGTELSFDVSTLSRPYSSRYFVSSSIFSSETPLECSSMDVSEKLANSSMLP
mmetsp:Transcript_591/g.920  ORF Transcript_591/g.920 Transcript_591/m.920 type:complete len:254 (+) Transcript_591:766-1527(+)